VGDCPTGVLFAEHSIEKSEMAGRSGKMPTTSLRRRSSLLTTPTTLAMRCAED
jgi:hypothetical protein